MALRTRGLGGKQCAGTRAGARFVGLFRGLELPVVVVARSTSRRRLPTCRWPMARPPRLERLPPAEHRRRTERRLRPRLELVQLRLERQLLRALRRDLRQQLLV